MSSTMPRPAAQTAGAGLTLALPLLLVVLGACMPDARNNDPKDVAVVGGGDSGSDGNVAGQDASTGDGSAADVDAGDVAALPVGCASDDDCKAFKPPLCKTVSCDSDSGLCVVGDEINGTPCGDADPCVLEPTCLKGACLGKAKDCDDGEYCTTDSCVAGSGCVATPNALGCDDGDACTVVDKCSEGSCKGTAIVCPGAKPPCLISTCDPKAGCKLQPVELANMATVTCNDGLACTGPDVCAGGACKGKLKICPDDGNPCTAESCQPQNGNCVSGALGYTLLCDDGDACTADEACLGDACIGVKLKCDDANPCTDDACDKAKGCTHLANDKATCNDKDPCTGPDACKDGVCGGAALKCDDGNVCTNDSCVDGFGCTAKNSLSPCSDGDLCSANDACDGGACKGTAVSCDDGNPCTKDTCDSAIGCDFTPLANASACPDSGQCWGSVCVVAACGNTSCEYNENSETCAKDCPEGGGACSSSDKACIVQCEKDVCGAPSSACAADAGCGALESCVVACSDEACQLACLGKQSPKTVQTWRGLRNCLSAKCLKNGWSGKNCNAASGAFPACVKACQAAVCYSEEIACYAKVGCAAIDNCVGQCADGSPSCVKECFKFGTDVEIELFDDLTVCMNLKCL